MTRPARQSNGIKGGATIVIYIDVLQEERIRAANEREARINRQAVSGPVREAFAQV